MTRRLRSDTHVQRGDPASVPEEERRRGYERRDAPPKGVAWGVAAFIGLMLIGLVAAAPVVALIDRGLPPDVPIRRSPQPPEPRLLVDPQIERQRIEAAQDAQLARGAIGIDEAMQRVAAAGWDTAPAPSTQEAARNHAAATR